ncbi:MAG: hypothetical protein NC412_11715 [Roseburia sp.]|nr:hypothetical protein [Roseburia sp.]MCM1279371.1 hypothetical protein [Robinsoniella sp.]
MKDHKILPFYMSYPLPIAFEDDRDMVKDLEYLQQMYPMGAKKLLAEVNKALSILDYEGSMIYDQYPDRFMLYKMGKDILEGLRKNPTANKEDEQLAKLLEWDGIDELILVILFFELLKRRHQNNGGYLKF